jgi:hypothetical protein
MNQIPTHKSKKSPYELFKQQVIPLKYFHPIGNLVVVLSQNKKKSKLDPRGELGKLIGFNAELKSYRILRNDGIIVNSKSVEFLDFNPSDIVPINDNKLLVETLEKSYDKGSDKREDTINIKEEEEDDPQGNNEEDTQADTDGESDEFADAQDVADDLVPQPEVGRFK